MTREEFKIKLDDLNIPKDSYSINELPLYSGYVLQQVGTKWHVFLFDKGDESPHRIFESESDALKNIYEALISYYIGVKNDDVLTVKKEVSRPDIIYLPESDSEKKK